jgi:hypothetical protein
VEVESEVSSGRNDLRLYLVADLKAQNFQISNNLNK